MRKCKKIRAYITCPVTHSRKRLALLPEIEETAKRAGLETFVFRIGGTPKDIFERDYKQLKTCKILIAEVSEASHGVGIEIGMAYCLGLKRILLLEKGKRVTKFAQGMPGTAIIEYESISDLKKKLGAELGKEIYKN